MPIQDFRKVSETWTKEDWREWLSSFLDSIIVRSAEKRRIPVSERLAVRIKEPGHRERWLLSDGLYADEPFSAKPNRFAKNERLARRTVRESTTKGKR